MSPGLHLLGPGVSVGLESEEGRKRILPRPLHHKAVEGRGQSLEAGSETRSNLLVHSSEIPAVGEDCFIFLWKL